MYPNQMTGESSGVASAPDLSSLNDPLWFELLNNAHEIHAPAGTEFVESNFEDGLAFLRQGSLRIYEIADDGRELFLYKLHAGDICLLPLLLRDHIQHCNIKAVCDTECSITVLPRRRFEEVMEHIPTLRNYVLSSMGRHMHILMRIIDHLAFHTLSTRLLHRLNDKQREQNSDLIRTTHQELASELGTSREVVSRLLKGFESQSGCIRLRRGAIEILSNQQLQSAMAG
ncbi:MAG: Crp/Fnr family transcriptional regulator, partial [Gammaproteobacteria bacterium]|nr:Crp/Fnr family transcriptional regulator [Gammaproteobacteria bacterium]